MTSNVVRAGTSVLALFFFATCATSATMPRRRAVTPPTSSALLDEIEQRTFRWFWDTTNPKNGLVPDRWPTKSFSSVAAVGFGLNAYAIGAQRGYITREEAAERTLTTLRFFRDAPQSDANTGVTGYRGFFYHFLDMESGSRFETVELSTIDTALFVAGALFAQSYFDRDNATEKQIREVAEEIYRRVEWSWFQQITPAIVMAWTPEQRFSTAEYRGYNEAMLLYVLALGSPTHPIGPEAWTEYTKTYQWGTFYGQEHLGFAPLFGHQYSHVWIDFRGIRDAYMREKGIDYFENSRRATYGQRGYAIDNPKRWKGWGENVWGLTACDGPLDATFNYEGEPRTFFTYSARGASFNEIRDDGTIAPTAALGSLPFAPEIVIPAVEEMHRRYGSAIYKEYGFLDAFNTSFTFDVRVQHGHRDPVAGWVDNDYLGIDQGPIIAMIENWRSGLVWEMMKKNPHIVRGLKRAGFTGGWLQ